MERWAWETNSKQGLFVCKRLHLGFVLKFRGDTIASTALKFTRNKKCIYTATPQFLSFCCNSGICFGNIITFTQFISLVSVESNLILTIKYVTIFKYTLIWKVANYKFEYFLTYFIDIIVYLILCDFGIYWRSRLSIFTIKWYIYKINSCNKFNLINLNENILISFIQWHVLYMEPEIDKS